MKNGEEMDVTSSVIRNLTRQVKGKVFPLQARLWPRGWVEVLLYSFMTTALEGGEWSASRPGRSLPPLNNNIIIIIIL